MTVRELLRELVDVPDMDMEVRVAPVGRMEPKQSWDIDSAQVWIGLCDSEVVLRYEKEEDDE